MATVPDFPRDSPVVTPGRWTIALDWDNWLQAVSLFLTRASALVGRAPSLTTQAASIGPTTLVRLAAPGLFRLSYYARITQAATTSCSLQIILRWTDGGVVRSFTDTTTTNATTSYLSGVLLVRSDALADVTVEVVYGSVGATPMQYALDVRAEEQP